MPHVPTEPPSPQDLLGRIEKACEFILARKRAHAEGIAWEVGEYLFERFYHADLDYIERRDPRKTDSLRDIAAGSGIPRMRLATWIRAYVARKYLGPAGIDVDLTVSELEALRPLVLHPDAARAILEVRRRLKLPVKRLDALAVAWRRRLDEGGRLEDLVAAPLPDPNPADPSSGHPHRPRPHGPLDRQDLVVIRLAGVVLRWLRNVSLAPSLRTSVAGELTRLRAQVASAAPPAGPQGPGGVLEPAAPTVELPGGPLGPVGPSQTGDTGGPATDLVAEAVRFILERLRRHGMAFTLEVGRYLFEHVYDGDRSLFRNGGWRWQRDTIRRIAQDPRVGLEDNFLYKAIHVFLLSGQVSQVLPPGEAPQLPPTTWEALWPLEDRPEALVPTAQWAAEERVPAATVAELAALVAPYLAHGGSLDDLFAGSEARPPDTPYRRIERLLGVMAVLVARRPVLAASRPRALAALDACLAAAAPVSLQA
ncbi:MAG: hypothetical protein HY905_08945 [Deltaproteobacteria bacterium]|nr:hypothetical protein [Deltaproteobacteria bacterium]